MSDFTNVIRTGDAFAAAIVKMPEDKRGGWVMYVLEILEGALPEGEIEVLLLEVNRLLAERLEAGGS